MACISPSVWYMWAIHPYFYLIVTDFIDLLLGFGHAVPRTNNAVVIETTFGTFEGCEPALSLLGNEISIFIKLLSKGEHEMF